MKGITRKGGSYLARLSVGAIRQRKTFNPKDYVTEEAAYEAAKVWLLAQQEAVREFATGKQSKYRIRDEVILTQELLKEYLHYDALTGVFTWLKSKANSVKVGNIAGCTDNNNYIVFSLFNKMYKAHRLAYMYMEGFLPVEGMLIDHIDRNASNNAWNNLRLSTYSQNLCNSVTKVGVSGIKGVTFLYKVGRWRGNVELAGKKLVKDFKTVEEAAAWVREAREQLHGEFTNHG